MKKFCWLTSALLLASCTVGPDYVRPDFYDDTQIADSLDLSEKSNAAPNPDWHRDFNDDTLNALVASAMTRNFDVKSAVAALRASRENLRIAQVAYLPTVNATSNYTRLKPSDNNPIAYRESYYTAGLDASWEIDIWGAGRRQSEQAGAQFASVAANLENVLISVKAQTVSLYFSLRAAQEQVALLEQNIGLQEAVFALTSELYESGLADLSDMNQAKYALENMKGSLPPAQNAVEAYKNALTLITGNLPRGLNDALAPDGDNALARGYVLDFDILYSLPVSAVRFRPDVRMAEWELVAQNAAVGRAVAAMYPNVSVSALIGFQAEHFADILKSGSQTYSAAPSITAPLFHWGALLRQVRAQKAVRDQYAAAYQQALLNAITDVGNRINDLKAGQMKLGYIDESLRNIRSAVYLSLVRYREGLIPLNTLLTQTQDLLQTQSALVSAKQDVYAGVVAFYKAMGV